MSKKKKNSRRADKSYSSESLAASHFEKKNNHTVSEERILEVALNKAEDIDEKVDNDDSYAEEERFACVKDDTQKEKDENDVEASYRADATNEEILKAMGFKNDIKNVGPKHVQVMVVTALKVLLPVAAFAIIIAVMVSFANTKRAKESEVVNSEIVEETQVEETVIISTVDTQEPLEENAYENVNQLMATFYKALADGDLDTVKKLRDYNDETELITTEKKSEYIETYDNLKCYTQSGIEENSYFVYVSYEVKIKDIATKAPGLNAFYVYTAEDGNLIIDGNMEEDIEAALKLVTGRDEVADLYTKVDVSYNEAITSDEALNTFMIELPSKIKTSVGEALAQLEVQETETAGEDTVTQEQETDIVEENQRVNQIVKATDTVNVRSSDSEEADRIGRIAVGTELTRTELKINGWSKVIYEGKEAYIKSDYLELVSAEEVSESSDSVKATTNVNVRNAADQSSDAIGTAQSGNYYEVLEDLGEWYKINYNGQEGYVKAEYFE